MAFFGGATHVQHAFTVRGALHEEGCAVGEEVHDSQYASFSTFGAEVHAAVPPLLVPPAGVALPVLPSPQAAARVKRTKPVAKKVRARENNNMAVFHNRMHQAESRGSITALTILRMTNNYAMLSCVSNAS
jgi:hypothetical protein